MNLPLLIVAIAFGFYIFSVALTILLNTVKEFIKEIVENKERGD